LTTTQHDLITSLSNSRSAPLKQQITTHAHPLDPLVASEIVATSQAVRRYSDALQVPLERLLFNSITLREPPKLSVLKWAGIVQDPEVLNADSVIKRQAEVSLFTYQAVVRMLNNRILSGPLPGCGNRPSIRVHCRSPNKSPLCRDIYLDVFGYCLFLDPVARHDSAVAAS